MPIPGPQDGNSGEADMPNDISIRRPPGAISLPDKGDWELRFEIHSESSGRVYVISRNKHSGKWGCSCPSWITRRYCKHLQEGCGLSPSQIHGYGQITGPKSRRGMD